MIPADWNPEGQWELSLEQLHELVTYVASWEEVWGTDDEIVQVAPIRNLVNGYLHRLEQGGRAIRPDDDDDQADELPRQYKGTWSWEEEEVGE